MPRRVLFCLLLTAAGCGDGGRPCGATCPPLEGGWRMTYENGTRSPECAAIAPPAPPAELEITRAGSTAKTEAIGQELTGTIYETFDFRLGGSRALDGGAKADLDSITLRGRYLPAPRDGGPTLTGTWSGRHLRAAPAGTKTCVMELPYTAAPR